MERKQHNDVKRKIPHNTRRKLKGTSRTKGGLSSSTERHFNTITTKDGTRIKAHPQDSTLSGYRVSLGNPLNGYHNTFAGYSNIG